MNEEKRFVLASLFGDAQPHTYIEIFNLYQFIFKERKEENFERNFKQLLLNNWFRRLWKAPSFKHDVFELARRGDLYLREAQIRRGGNYAYFKSNMVRGLAK